MDPAVTCDQRKQAIDIRGPELLQCPVLQQVLHDRMLIRQFLQNGRIGGRCPLGGLLQDGQAKVLEQHLPQLQCRVDVERFAGRFVDLFLQGGEAAPQAHPQLFQVGSIGPDARLLHPGQHPDKQ